MAGPVPGAGPVFEDETSSAEAAAALAVLGFGDGLPVVPPTEDRLAALLATVPDPDEPLGTVAPLFTEVTARNVAYHCVLAGAEPGDLPLVLAAVLAGTEPDLNLLGVQTTTGSAGIGLAVHGPATERLGLSSGPGCLGGAPTVNARIGRALALALRGIGGASAGEIDMSTMGQPGKTGLCFAHDDASPLSSFEAGASAFTVFAFSGTAEVLPLGGGDDVTDVVVPLAECIATSRLAMGDPLRPLPNEELVVLTPEIAQNLQRWGIQRDDLARQVSELAHLLVLERVERHAFAHDRAPDEMPAPAEVVFFVAGGPGIKMTYLPTWKGGSRSVTRPLTS